MSAARISFKKGLATAALTTTLAAGSAFAGPREQAYTIYTRLNGVPPTPEKLVEIEGLVNAGELRRAALAAIDTGFYNVTLRNMVAPWTSETQQVRVPLNDMIATIIGMVRDEVPFNQVLSADMVYIAVAPDKGLPDYTIGNNRNDHFNAVDTQGLPLDEVLAQKKQSELTPFLTPDVASGVLTTWGFAKEYYNAGTNRAAVRFTVMNFLCQDMEKFSDTSRADFRVRQDVTRAPGGDSSVYKNKCQGCHAGMDPLAGAFAYMDYIDNQNQGGLVFDPSKVNGKYLRNATEFQGGYVTTDDSWQVLWHEGQNAVIGWNGRKSGKGTKSWGEMIASTDRFATCMATQTLKTVCNVDDQSPEGKLAINQLANSFRAKNRYNMKNMFAQAAVMCRGE